MENPLVISHLILRRVLGTLGIALPFILPIGVILSNSNSDPFQPSISHYYYTNMGDVFVGVLWGFGLFLFSYKGYDVATSKVSDNVLTNIAGLFAVGVSLFPTVSARCIDCHPSWVGTLHLGFAALFFLILGYMSIFVFTDSNKPPEERSPSKKRRNVLFIIFGIIIWACMIALFVYFMFFNTGEPTRTVYIFETISLLAFGTSWLIKGRALRFMGL